MREEYEKRILGILIKHPEVNDKSYLTKEHFTGKNKIIYEKIQELLNKGVEVNILVLSSSLPAIPVSYIAELTNDISMANWYYYQTQLNKYYVKEKLHSLRSKIGDWINDEDVIQKIQDELDNIDTQEEHYKVQKIKDLLPETINYIEDRYKMRINPPGLKTGIEKLDNLITRDPRKLLFYIGGRPSEGKTALMLNIISNQLLLNKRVGLISLESSNNELILRMLSANSEVNSINLSTGFLREREISKILDTASQFNEANLFFYDEPNLSLQKVTKKIRYMVKTLNVEIVFIDYLQLISYHSNSLTKRHEEIAYISRSLKDEARRLNIPIVVTAQLRRDAEGRRPRLGDFSESSQIEKDADIAVLIYHRFKEKYNQTTRKMEAEYDDWWLCLDKNRDGETKVVPVNFIKEYVKFEGKIKNNA